MPMEVRLVGFELSHTLAETYERTSSWALLLSDDQLTAEVNANLCIEKRMGLVVVVVLAELGISRLSWGASFAS